MKTLIIYSTTYGFTGECVEKLAHQLDGEVKTVNALTEGVPSIKEYDRIIIGGSIYAGQIHKKLKEYMDKNIEELGSKRLGLFICCGLMDNIEANMKNAFPEKLLKSAVARECFGGELRVDRMKFLHRMMTNIMKKVVEKEGKEPPRALPENIARFARIMNDVYA